MSNILNNVSLDNMMLNVSDVLSAISPFLTLLIGVLLAFFVFSFILDIINPKKKD